MADLNPQQLYLGLNLDFINSQLKPGQYTYALNAIVENFDGNMLTIQNEQGATLCTNFPAGYKVIGGRNILEKNLIVFFLVTPDGLHSEIGVVDTSTCLYTKKVNADCLGFHPDKPIHKMVHKVTNFSTEIYWADPIRRYLDLDKIPYIEIPGTADCESTITDQIDCNKMAVQPDFSIPEIDVKEVTGDGELEAGTYQFGISYSNALSEGYTGVYNITNPISIFDPNKITQEFNYTVNKSINLEITGLDTTGYYDYFNLVVVKTVNNIITPYLVGTYKITKSRQTVSYTGQNKTEVNLTMMDIMEKFPIYDTANDVTTAQDIIIWSGVTTNAQVNYQKIWSKVKLQWQTTKLLGKKTYENPIYTEKYKGFFRDEIYALEGFFQLKNGYQTNSFHIPARIATPADLTPVFNEDVLDTDNNECNVTDEPKPRWQVYNTAYSEGFETCVNPVPPTPTPDPEPTPTPEPDPTPQNPHGVPQEFIGRAADEPDSVEAPYEELPNTPDFPVPSPQTTNTPSPSPNPIPPVPPVPAPGDCFEDPCYEGPYEYGEFGYYESTERYPCDEEIWGIDADKPIRHHRMPDSLITHIHDNQGYIYPLGIKIDTQQIKDLIEASDLTEAQKSEIVGFGIARGNRANNKSIVARGLINNVGKYKKDNTTYFYPNYPYNDLRPDPFISRSSTTLEAEGDTETEQTNCIRYRFQNTNASPGVFMTYNITNCDGVATTVVLTKGEVKEACSKTEPRGGDEFRPLNACDGTGPLFPMSPATWSAMEGFATEDSFQRYTFHSPDTHFYQPGLGNILKIETAEYGKSEGHYQQVKNHAKYKFVSKEAYATALGIGVLIGFASGTWGMANNLFNGTAAFTAFQSFINIVEKVIPRRNFAYQFNSIGKYEKFVPVKNDGKKQRRLDIAAYATPGMLSVGDVHHLNNYQRESSVYLRTSGHLPPPSDITLVEDNSRWTLGNEGLCKTDTQVQEKDICSYYATIKKAFVNQYGQLYSYDTIDTGFRMKLANINPLSRFQTIFGGDCFINKFGLKTKVPFFIDNRVESPDDSDVFYNEIGNIGNPNYWFSTDASEGKHRILGINVGPLFGIKAHNFDCGNRKFFYDTGKIYLFAYGIPYYFCESEVNVDMRQAFNGAEGDFYPHVGGGIPDDWLQETNVTIAQDNKYLYNRTFSKQNKENSFSHLPEDYLEQKDRHILDYRAVFSEKQEDIVNYRRNNWLIYRPAAKFDFPQNFGRLISLDGIENRQVLARFENKTFLYNALITSPTSAQSIYLGQSLFSPQAPPLDYGDTDLGYAGSQHRFLLKTEYGHISADAKRGQVFLIQGQQAKSITDENVSKFFQEYLPFAISKAFPEYPIDNHFNGCGLHGVFDKENKRFILSKIDYTPSAGVSYVNKKFMAEGKEIQLGDPKYFCNNSFTMSYSFRIGNWASYHSYIPNYYVGHNQGFYGGMQNGLWKFGDSLTLFNNYFGKRENYVIEYPYSYKLQDEILQSMQDYSRIVKYDNFQSFIETDDIYFNKCVIYSNQQCSGVLELTKKPKNNLSLQGGYPKYGTDSKEILFSKSDSFYNFNTFWDLVKDPKVPIWKKSCESVSIFKELNQDNMSYSKRAYRKAPLRSKELKIRMINDKHDDHKFISQFTVTETMKSFK